jgi:hypothetical protein
VKYALAAILAAAMSVPAPAQSQTAMPSGEQLDKHGLIKPTSKGSSGSPDDAGGGAAIDSDGNADTGPVDAETRNAGGMGTNPQTMANPYPDATSGTGVVNGDAVNGTGALNSAHPGH